MLKDFHFISELKMKLSNSNKISNGIKFTGLDVVYLYWGSDNLKRDVCNQENRRRRIAWTERGSMMSCEIMLRSRSAEIFAVKNKRLVSKTVEALCCRCHESNP